MIINAKFEEQNHVLDCDFGVVSHGDVSHITNKDNPHKVTAEQTGARPNTWMPTAQEVGARPNTWIPTSEEIGAYNKAAVYYPSSSNADIDTVTDGLMLVAGDLAKNCPVGGFVYIMQMFYGRVSSDTNRTQIAFPYNIDTNKSRTIYAIRMLYGGTWSSWRTITPEAIGARPNTWMPTASDVGAAPAASVAYIDKNDNETVILPPSGGDGGDSSPGSGGLTAEQVQAMIDTALAAIPNAEEASF